MGKPLARPPREGLQARGEDRDWGRVVMQVVQMAAFEGMGSPCGSWGVV